MPGEVPQIVGLLLVPDFALMSYACVVEPLRAANLIAGRELFRWVHIATRQNTVTASCGATVPCDATIRDVEKLDLLLVCAGGEPATFNDNATFAWLRRLAVSGTRVGGVSGGPFILVKAGIMDGIQMTIHWRHALPLLEAHPNILLTRSLFIIDRNRLTCAGGTAALDMMHALIAERHGAELARNVSDWFLHTEIRSANGAQRASAAERYGVYNTSLIAAIELMERHAGRPLRRNEVAQRIGISTRQLDRLFATKLKRSFQNHYRDIRLERSRDLLHQSSARITEIAVACGFSSASHFTRVYRESYGATPSMDRNASKEPRGKGRRSITAPASKQIPI
jgi:transcriptional regulator GlxA family with amidase domain